MTIPKGPGDAVQSAKTFPQFLRSIADAYGDELAVALRNEDGQDEALSFVDIERQSAILARGLIARGVGKGTRVGFIHGNGPAFAVIFSAIARAGGVAIPISTLLKADELVRVLRQSDVTGVIVQRTLLGKDYVERLCDALPELRESQTPALRIARTPYLRWVISDGQDLPPAVQDIGVLARDAESFSETLLLEVEKEIHPTDQLVEIYTSGSMALPKGVRHDHGPVLFRARYIQTMITPSRGEEIYAPLPMFWVGGLMMFLLPNMIAGAATICSEATPTSSRMAMGSVLAPEDLALLSERRPFWALGMSETLGPYSYGDIFRVAEFPVCAPLDNIADGYEVRVANEANTPVADGEVGEIQVRGYPLTSGLHKLKRADYFTADGFYHTGDMGLVDGRRVHFVGRNGDMIKTAGSNVSPAEVEMEMQLLDGVHSAYVVGLPDPERGQLLVAAVVARDGETLDFDAIQKELRQKLSAYKVPRCYVLIDREEVPMLASNKVSRRQIETLMTQKLGR